MIEYLLEGVFLTENAVQDLRMPAYRKHLREYCEFSEPKLRVFFGLIHTNPNLLCKLYLIRIPKHPDEDWPQLQILKILSAATRFGPQTERLLKFTQREI